MAESKPTKSKWTSPKRVVLATAEGGVYTGELSYGLVVQSSIRFEPKQEQTNAK